MKKTFELSVSNKTDSNHLDSIKHQIKKYISRERRKKLPDNVDYWDFDCNIGDNEQETSSIHISKVNSVLSNLALEKKKSFYIEILAKPGYRKKK